MNRSTIDRDNILERFVLGQLPDDELDAFLVYQMLHPEIKAEVEAVRAVVKSVRGLDATAASPRNVRVKRRNLSWLLIVTGAFLIGLWWWSQPEKQSDSPLSPPPAYETRPEARPGPDPAAPLPAAPPPDKQEPRAPRQIAAQLRPNPRLESLLGPRQYRDNGEGHVQWVEAPPREQTLTLEKGRLNFALTASVHAPAAALANLRCLLFSNSASDYEAFRPLHTGPFSAQETAERTFLLSYSAKLTLKPGLYYYLIEDQESGELYFVGKLTVR